MGILDVFKRGTPVERALKDLREPFAQPEVRREAMSKLLDIGTQEAFDALLVRYTFNCNGHIADESEKKDLTEYLVEAGEKAVGPLKRFIAKEKQVTFPIRALSRIVERGELLKFLLETLRKMEPLDHRTTEQKRLIIDSLKELGGPTEAPAITPYLNDHNDDVQYQAVEALERMKNPDTYPALIEVCIGDKHAARIQRRAAAALESLEASVKADFDRFNDELKGEFHLGKKGQLMKKTRPTSA